MKKLCGFNLWMLLTVGLLLCGFAALALAGGMPGTKRGDMIQNLTGIAPTKGQSGCVTQAITKGLIQGRYSSMSGYQAYEGEVVTAAGAAEPVKWEIDGTQVATGPNFKFTNNAGTAYSRAVQRVYSASSRSLTSCTRRQ